MRKEIIMQVSFGKGLVSIGGKFYNPDAIASFEQVKASDGTHTRFDFIDGKTDFQKGNYVLGEVAAACIEAQTKGTIACINEKSDNIFG